MNSQKLETFLKSEQKNIERQIVAQAREMADDTEMVDFRLYIGECGESFTWEIAIGEYEKGEEEERYRSMLCEMGKVSTVNRMRAEMAISDAMIDIIRNCRLVERFYAKAETR